MERNETISTVAMRDDKLGSYFETLRSFSFQLVHFGGGGAGLRGSGGGGVGKTKSRGTLFLGRVGRFAWKAEMGRDEVKETNRKKRQRAYRRGNLQA